MLSHTQPTIKQEMSYILCSLFANQTEGAICASAPWNITIESRITHKPDLNEHANKAPSTRIRFHRKRYRFQSKRNDCISSTHRFRIVFIFFSLVTVYKSYRFRSFSCRCKAKTQRKVCGFDENNMKTYSCRRGHKVCIGIS